MRRLALLLSVLLGLTAGSVLGAEIILPQNRLAFYSDERIEIAVAGLAAEETANVRLVPNAPGHLRPVEFPAKGDGGTVTFILPPFALGPARYSLELDGKATGVTVTVASSVRKSSMLLSQTVDWNQVKAAAGNFLLGNAFEFGLPGPDGMPTTDPQGKRSRGMQAFERAIEMDLPTIVYMYWTGYVTHKPFGSEKSWAEPSMQETMGLLNLHTAQRLRRYQRNLISIGTLDEPGLSWGRTPAGGSASGFPNWDEKRWYEDRGWKYTDDPASRPDADWMKYMDVRCDIIRESNEFARAVLKAFVAGVPFATDLYALHAVMDGTNALSQTVNDIPTTHVFLDWGMSRAGVIGAAYLEKAHDPTAKVAHATNGQLMEATVPQPNQRDAYRVTLNGLLASGMRSNWWLNTGGMAPEDLAAVNEPAIRWGPMFEAMSPEEHDTAVLWSWTELCMREKDLCAQEARRRPGERITVRVKGLPKCSAYEGTEQDLEVNAYSVGGNYREQVLTAHQALGRAGYPAHILHEKLLPKGVLRHYRTLVVIGQTHALPRDVTTELSKFVKQGGKIVADRTTTVKLPGTITTAADYRDPAYRWTVPFTQDERKFATLREASAYKTNLFMDTLPRNAVGPMKAAMRKTASRPAIISECGDLIAERHVCGNAALFMVLNAHEELPKIGQEQRHWLYNYAPLRATFTLQGIPKSAMAYAIEGADWGKVQVLKNPSAPQTLEFAPGEMKLFYVASPMASALPLARKPQVSGGVLDLRHISRPGSPVRLTVKAPDGSVLYDIYRASRQPDGGFSARFPLGLNAAPGKYSVQVQNLLGGADAFTCEGADLTTAPTGFAGNARIFGAEHIRALGRWAAGDPDFPTADRRLVIALGSKRPYADIANDLAARLRAAGLKVVVKPEAEIIRRVRYPRVFDPYIKVFRPVEKGPAPTELEVKREVTLESAPDGRTLARTAAGDDVGDGWREAGTLATVVGEGFVDLPYEQFYEPGCQLHVEGNGQVQVLRAVATMVKATPEARERWSRPWTRLSSYLGTDKLCPQLPEAYSAEDNLILLGDSTSGELVAALQASELLEQVADMKYPGPGKALVGFARGPFALARDVVLIGACDEAGVRAGVEALVGLVKG
jgi:hypothetical protein